MVFGQTLTSLESERWFSREYHPLLFGIELLVLPCSKTNFHGCFEGYVPQICLTPCKQVGGTTWNLPLPYSNKFGCVDRHLLWPWCTLPGHFNSPEKVIYLLESERTFSYMFPSEWCKPPKCCVLFVWLMEFCDTLVFNMFHNHYYFTIQPMMKLKVFILIWIQITSKTNDMKMQIMKLMIWKDVYKYIHHCQFKFPRFCPLANGTLKPLSCYIYIAVITFQVPCLSLGTPESLLGNGAVLKRTVFFNLDGWAWKWCWKKMMLEKFYLFGIMTPFWDAAGKTAPLNIQDAQKSYVLWRLDPLKSLRPCTEF